MSSTQGLSEEISRKNAEIYNDTGSPVWYLAVYGPLHEGWEFINLGGQRVLDRMARQFGLSHHHRVIEFCSGQAGPSRYLVQKYGCNVTSVEINPHQVDRAREHLRRLPEAIAARIHLVQADVLSWTSEDRYDLAFSLDSMMLLQSVAEATARAFRALRPGGCLTFATICSGPKIDARTQSFALEVDGMVSLLNCREYVNLLQTQGFSEVSAEDLTQLAVESSTRMDQAFDENRDSLIVAIGERGLEGWRNVGKAYLDAFREARLAYALVTAWRNS